MLGVEEENIMKFLYVNLKGIWTNISEIENVTVDQLSVSTWIEKNINNLDDISHIKVIMYKIEYIVHVSQIQILTK